MIEQWLTYLSTQGKSEATINSYRRGVQHFATWNEQTYGQSFDPAAIIPRDVMDWKSHQQTVERAKPTTINQRLSALSQFFSWVIEHGYAHTDPTANVKQLRLEARQPQALDKKQTRRLLRQVHKEKNLRDIALVELLLGTGLRISEALDLTRADIKISERSGQVTVRKGKGGQFRTIPLTTTVRQALTDYLEQSMANSQDTKIWTGQRGALTGSAVYKSLKNYAFRAGLDPDMVSAHILRHTFATRYLEKNSDDLRGLAAILGHASLDTVMIYTQPAISELADRMERTEQD